MRKIFSLVLVAAVVALGVPAAAFAAPVKARAQQAATGGVNGVAHGAKGESLPNYTVRARNPVTGQIAGTTTSNGQGAFSITGLQPGNYVIEVVNSAGQVVGLSSSVAVPAGAVVSVTITATAAGAVGAAAAGGGFSLLGLGTAASVGVIAAAGAGAIVGIVAVTGNASPSR